MAFQRDRWREYDLENLSASLTEYEWEETMVQRREFGKDVQ